MNTEKETLIRAAESAKLLIQKYTAVQERAQRKIDRLRAVVEAAQEVSGRRHRDAKPPATAIRGRRGQLKQFSQDVLAVSHTLDPAGIQKGIFSRFGVSYPLPTIRITLRRG